MTPPSPGLARAKAAWRASPGTYGLWLRPTPTGEFYLYRHTAAISQAFVWCMSKPDRRLIINCPNQVGKSLTTSVLGPLWMLDHWPFLRVVLVTHGIDFASKWGQQVRDLAADNEESLRMRIERGRDARVDEWRTTVGGGMFSTSISRLAGRPADRIVIDDPYAGWQEAHSETIRESVWNSWQTDILGRLRHDNPASICLTMTRYHFDDLTGRLTDPKRNPEAHRWRVLRLPALADEPDDPLGRGLGESLDPRIPREFWLQKKAGMSSYFAAGMLQQRPAPASGGIVKRSWWKRYTLRPGWQRFDELLASWDMAFKETDDSSFVVGQVWGRMGGDFYLLDQIRDRMDFPSTIVAVQNLANRWPMAAAKLVEDKANGPAVIATLARKVPGLIAVEVKGSKEARAHAVSPYIESGNVWLPADELAPWVGDFVEEWAAFPKGVNDDQVDASTQALDRLAANVGVQSDYTHEGGRR